MWREERLRDVVFSAVCAGHPAHPLHHPGPPQAQGHPHRQGLRYSTVPHLSQLFENLYLTYLVANFSECLFLISHIQLWQKNKHYVSTYPNMS